MRQWIDWVKVNFHCLLHLHRVSEVRWSVDNGPWEYNVYCDDCGYNKRSPPAQGDE